MASKRKTKKAKHRLRTAVKPSVVPPAILSAESPSIVETIAFVAVKPGMPMRSYSFNPGFSADRALWAVRENLKKHVGWKIYGLAFDGIDLSVFAVD